MQKYVPDGNIACENCDRFFVSYTHIYARVNIDAKNELAKAAYNGMINRITCPYCNTEFTYEAPLFAHSYINKFAVISQFPDCYKDITSMHRAAKISGLDSWKLRNCRFAMDASEKIRIFSNGLNDGIVEIIKLKAFSDYSQMNLLDEYITFEGAINDCLVFTHRDYTDRIIEKYNVPKSMYNTEPDNFIPNGRWIKIDRNWAQKTLE